MLYKKCRICGQIKEVADFHKKKGAPAGVRNECKECVKDIQKKYKDAPDFKEKRKKYDENRYVMVQNEIIFKSSTKNNVVESEYRQIDDLTDITNLFLENVRGSIRLINGRIKLPKDRDQEEDKFIQRQIP